MSEQPFKKPKIELRRNQYYLRNNDASKRDINQLKEFIKTIDTKIAILDEKLNLLNDKTDVIITKIKHTDNTISRINDFMISHIETINIKLDNITTFLETHLNNNSLFNNLSTNMDIYTNNNNFNDVRYYS